MTSLSTGNAKYKINFFLFTLKLSTQKSPKRNQIQETKEGNDSRKVYPFAIYHLEIINTHHKYVGEERVNEHNKTPRKYVNKKLAAKFLYPFFVGSHPC